MSTKLQLYKCLRVTASWFTFLVSKSEGHTCPGDEDQPQTKAASSWFHPFCSASLPGMWYQEEDLRNLMANSTAWDPRDPNSPQISAPVSITKFLSVTVINVESLGEQCLDGIVRATLETPVTKSVRRHLQFGAPRSHWTDEVAFVLGLRKLDLPFWGCEK